MFDIVNFFQEHKIHYFSTGNNVQYGWVNINCPFCSDNSNHLGVCIKQPRKVKCWRCGEHTLPKLLSEFSDKNIKLLYKEFAVEGEGELQTKTQVKKTQISSNDIQKIFQENSETLMSDYSCSLYKQYLNKRYFEFEAIKNNWKIRAGIETGEYKYRLMMPVYYNNKIVSFQGRDITGKQKNKYKTCHGTKINDYLYGLDYVIQNNIFIVEGVTDVWRLGKGNAVATFGIQYSVKQIELLVKKKVKKIIIYFDAEPQAQKAAVSLKATLELFGIKCKILHTIKDPAEQTNSKVRLMLDLLK